MAYRRERSVREVYEERFMPERGGPFPRGPGERRGPYRPEEEYGSGGFEGTRRFFPNGGGPRSYHSEDRGYHTDNVHFPREGRAGPTRGREDYPYPAQRGPREDSHPGRNAEFGSRAPPHAVRGGFPAARALPESGEDSLVQAILNLDRGRKAAPFNAPIRDRSPVRREVARSPHSRSGSSVSSRGYSPDRAKNLPFPAAQSKSVDSSEGHAVLSEYVWGALYSQQSGHETLDKIPGLSREGSPRSASPSKEDVQPPEVEPEEKPILPVVIQEEIQKPSESFQERRATAIAAKAQEIEKVYRQDCETFGMVVKMLVAKDPNLEKQLQVPLRENLGEIRERCLEDLKQFIQELDEVVRQPEHLVCDSTTPTAAALTSHRLNKGGLNPSSSF